ncbi:MAG: prephenate/arogenate dehydrogenase family protein [Robiginitomaculum sp.]
MSIFNRVTIIGSGLIGSSLARAIQAENAADTLIIYDNNASVRDIVSSLSICDEVFDNVEKSTQNSDLIILCVPPCKIADMAKEVTPHLMDGAILTDVGSVKSEIVETVTALMPKHAEFIGGHPIAGTEKSGPKAGFATLFQDRWCILTPQNEQSENAQKLKFFWQTLGSNVAFMDAKRHDLVLATTSHLPHLIAYALVGTAIDMETVTNNEVVKYSAAGFRDFTRIAASDPTMWRDVFLGNKDAVLEVLGRYITDLTELKRAVRLGDGDALMVKFTKTRDIRKRIVDAGQDSSEPNFGRNHSDN